MVNGDDTYAARLYNEVRASKRMAWKFSRDRAGRSPRPGVEYSLAGIKATLKTPAGRHRHQVARWSGPHNLENILAAAGMALGRGLLAAGTCRRASTG